MESSRLARRLAAVAGGIAIVAMGALTASCAKEEQKAPETTTTTTTSPTLPGDCESRGCSCSCGRGLHVGLQ